MNLTTNTAAPAWPLWKKILFRFFFIYFTLQLTPWTWLDSIPGVTTVTKYYDMFNGWSVTTANQHFFHIRMNLVPTNGSGDTSFGWAQVVYYLSFAVVGCVIWSALDRKRKNYNELNYWLCLFSRYFVSLVALAYGLDKVIAEQMPFPTLHQMAIPLGDFTPMRLAWMFMGYSHTYQVFSGLMEMTAGLLLLNRRTATLGAIMAAGVFTNVVMLNFGYDIVVKIFSFQLLTFCLYLLVNESQRLINFLILNKEAPVSTLYNFRYGNKWSRRSRVVFKILFICLFLLFTGYTTYSQYKTYTVKAPASAIKDGMYEVTTFRLNKKDIPFSLRDTMRWQDMIFENGIGSIKTGDTIFRQRYSRGYFYFSDNESTHTLYLRKQEDTNGDPIMQLHYEEPDTNSIILTGFLRGDSLYVALKKMNHHFQLNDKPFHWLSEKPW